MERRSRLATGNICIISGEYLRIEDPQGNQLFHSPMANIRKTERTGETVIVQLRPKGLIHLVATHREEARRIAAQIDANRI